MIHVAAPLVRDGTATSESRFLKILLATPVNPRATEGNATTTTRWQEVLEGLDHEVRVITSSQSVPAAELLIALHARRCHGVVTEFRERHPEASVIVALTGTDLYLDGAAHPAVRDSLELADRIVVLQPNALEELPESLRKKTVVILQSAQPPRQRLPPREDAFEVCVAANLRAVKDPFRTARATRLLPPSSRIRVLHFGKVLDENLRPELERERKENPRYCWQGERFREDFLQELSRCRLLVLSSHAEGGANVLSEAIACELPIFASEISGSTGILGRSHPGLFPVKDTHALAALLHRVETQDDFREKLRLCSKALAPDLHPQQERRAWRKLLSSFSQPSS